MTFRIFRQLVCIMPLLAAARIWAAPYGPEGAATEFTQPDGSVLALRVFGDDFHARTETADGYTVAFDAAEKAYYYATVSADGTQLLRTETRVAPGEQPPAGLAKHLDIDPAVAKAQAIARHQEWDAATGNSATWSAIKAQRQAIEQAAADGGPAMAPPSFTTLGSKVGLTLLIDFSDDPATIPQASIIDFCNGDNYTGYGNNGSVKKYYQDNSNNLLTYTNTVTAYIRMAQPKTYYNNTSISCGTQGRLLLNDAIDILKALPNYATEILPTFDTLTVDGSNRVVACNVFYAGGNGGVWSYGLWPHSYSLASAKELSAGGKKVYKYQITNLGTSLSLGTFCHENGHMLCGYPDIYDYDYDSVGGAGGFCLMNSGGHGTNPVLICAYLRRASGWTTTTDLTSTSNLTGTLVSTVGHADFNKLYRYQKPGVSTEYYLFENRRKTGRDANIAASGIAIWHIDELGNKDNQSLVPNTTHANYECTLVQADNLWHFQSNSNSGDSKDLYYLGNTAAGYSNSLSDTSAPNAHWWDGTNSGLRVSDISAASTSMTLRFGLPANTVAISGPNGGEVLYQGSTQSITWSAAITGNVNIDLYKGGVIHSSLATNETNDGVFSWTISAGLPVANDYAIRISSTDNAGYADTSDAPFTITANVALVPMSASNWKYLHNNTNQGTVWRDRTFSDTSWTNATAEIGYGDGDEATAITRPTPRYATAYFRKHFTIDDPTRYSALTIMAEYDDAYAVYLNGTRVAGNLPTDPAYDYFSGTAIDDTITTTSNIPASLLVAGDNVVAVEIHQANSTSSDLSMNLSLHGTTAITPEIAVEQPVGTDLADGSASVSCGSAAVGASASAVTFTIRNTGTSDLTGLAVTKDGSHAADFAVGALGSTTLPPGTSTTFNVTFTPSAAGTRSAAIHIASNDLNENPFDITLSGSGLVPEIAVEQPTGTDLTDGVAVVSCGSSDISAPASAVIFTIRNTGSANLTGLTVAKDGSHAADFEVGALGLTSLAPGASTTFGVTFTPSASGTRAAAIHIASNDADEDPFDISLTGYGRTPLESWRQANFGSDSGTGETANNAHADSDSMPNLFEYAMGLDPAEDSPFPISTEETAGSISLVYPKNLAATDVTISYEESDDMGLTDPWEPVTLTEEPLGPPANGIQTIKATRNLGIGEFRKFLRIKVDTPP